MSPGLSASMVEVAAMFESAFRKRFRSSYESSPSLSPPDLPSQKRYRGTFELVEDDDEEDEEIKESLDSDSVSENAEDEGPTIEDEDPAAGDEGLSMGVESRGLDDEVHSVESDGLGLGEEEEAVPEGQQWAVPVVGTTISTPLGLGYGAFRRRELALEEDHVYSTFEPILTTWTNPEDGMVYIDVPAYPPPALPVQTPPSPEWSSGSLPISPSPSIVPSPISSSMIPLTRGLIRDHMVRLKELSPALFERYDRDIGELFTRSGATDALRAALWHAISDAQGENQELQLQLAEERR
ncbi:hypothetical protein Tco_1257962, partial [Tanacetum coccineum]